MIRRLLTWLLSAHPLWPVVVSIGLGLAAFELMRRGILPTGTRSASPLALIGLVLSPLLGGYLWHNESSLFGRAVGVCLVLFTGLLAGTAVVSTLM